MVRDCSSRRVAYHQGTELRYGERLTETQGQGTYGTDSSIPESAATLAQLMLVDWQADRRLIPDDLVIVTNYNGSHY